MVCIFWGFQHAASPRGRKLGTGSTSEDLGGAERDQESYMGTERYTTGPRAIDGDKEVHGITESDTWGRRGTQWDREVQSGTENDMAGPRVTQVQEGTPVHSGTERCRAGPRVIPRISGSD